MMCLGFGILYDMAGQSDYNLGEMRLRYVQLPRGWEKYRLGGYRGDPKDTISFNRPWEYL